MIEWAWGPSYDGVLHVMQDLYCGNQIMFGASEQAGKLTVQPGGSGERAIVVKGAANQTADLVQWWDSAGNIKASTSQL